jgi:multidrug efflux system membrane fusion protein
VLGLGAAAGAVYWPQYVENYFPGWTQRTATVRTSLPFAKAPEPTQALSRPGNSDARQAAIAARPPVPVDIDKVQRGPMPVRVDAVGTVQPVATVAIKTRIDAQIEKIFVADGAAVKQGDVLVKLDSRQIEAQIKQTEATIAKDRAQLEGATRDVNRLTDLFSRGSGTQLALDNARTTEAAAKATLASDQALLENQKVQLTWYTLNAPIDGRVGTFAAKAGNIVRSGDNTVTGTLATIVQTAPIYVAFSVPQATLASIREALARGDGEVRATPQGGTKSTVGKIAVLDNSIDSATGTIMLRAIFENTDDVLWPGQLCNVRVTLRTDPDVVSIPRTATQSGQNGNFVYIVDNGIAKLRPVKVARFQDGRDVIVEGLTGGETIVSDGGLLLVDGIRVDVRRAQADASKKGAT